MKSAIVLMFAIICCPISYSQVNFPDPSPLQTIRQKFGISAIELTYSRPGLKGRKMIGGTEPLDSVWRTGANAPTVIHFFSRVEFGGIRVDSGRYVIYSIPRQNHWTIILNNGLSNWGSDHYDTDGDFVRITVTPARNLPPVETMAFQFENIKAESCDLTLAWEDWKISIPIRALLRDSLRKQIEQNVKSSNPLYWFAAQFYYEFEPDYDKALAMITAAIESNEKNGRYPYWQYFYKARILKSLGRKEEALRNARLSIKYAKAHGNRNNYIAQAEELIRSLQ